MKTEDEMGGQAQERQQTAREDDEEDWQQASEMIEDENMRRRVERKILLIGDSHGSDWIPKR